MAYTDTLTGLSNRRARQSRFAEIMLGSKVEGHPLTVAIADLDRFERYNDTHVTWPATTCWPRPRRRSGPSAATVT
ncbi:GGDEF domain-containing protein [Actinoplanes sp. NPDC020271]|uniref:GGDEF domain-containing protein n=1 Tax=Actinoplanes sp. NPDC020271 TaxID=3363896 RepID=UPI00378DDC12